MASVKAGTVRIALQMAERLSRKSAVVSASLAFMIVPEYGRFWGRWNEQPGRGDDPGYLTKHLSSAGSVLSRFLAYVSATMTTTTVH
jgi:hypothetical protein